MPSAGLELAIPAIGRPETRALDRTVPLYPILKIISNVPGMQGLILCRQTRDAI